MAYTKTEQTVQNAKEDAGVVDSAIIEADEPVEVVYGQMINGNDVTGEATHFAAVSIERELDEDEQAIHGVEKTNFSSILVANEDGEASNDQILSVTDGDVDNAIEALEMVTEDGAVDFIEANNENFRVQDGETVRFTELEDEAREDEVEEDEMR